MRGENPFFDSEVSGPLSSGNQGYTYPRRDDKGGLASEALRALRRRAAGPAGRSYDGPRPSPQPTGPSQAFKQRAPIDRIDGGSR